MKLEMRGQMRLEQKMKLAPRMIQSMEILQLPLLALQERIEQELNGNPVLEIDEPSNGNTPDLPKEDSDEDSGEKDLTVITEGEGLEDFGRIDNLDEGYKEYVNQFDSFTRRSQSGEPDKKLEAIKNTAAPPQSLYEYLNEQWGLMDLEESVKKAGSMIIDYTDDRGYLTVRLEQLHNKDRVDFTFEDLKQALKLVQSLEPTGIGARDLKECLLIQMRQSTEDMGFEIRMVTKHMNELLENRLPEIAKKMNCSIEQIKDTVERMSRIVDFSPGLQIGQYQNHPIRADVIVEPLSEGQGYTVHLADSGLPSLRVSDYYSKMTKESSVNDKTKKFLKSNIRSAQWIIEAIEQRKSTLLKVAKAVVRYQKDFFDKGQLYLHPLPMAKVAKEVGVHVATVSRAVAGKYVQCYWGILPLRKFFSGGIEDDKGRWHSWEAVRAELQRIIDNEDKSKPLGDDQIKEELLQAGIKNIARRTVAKYRKLMNIPVARFRKKY